jgi:hypothetical protein
MITATGRHGFCLLCFFLKSRTFFKQGKPKAKVFPLPVSAIPITSRPSNKSGHVADWIAVGAENAAKGAYSSGSLAGRNENEVMGRKGEASGKASVILIECLERNWSISAWGTLSRAGDCE